MTPKSVRENIISLQGHITGIKKDVSAIKNNHLKHMSKRIHDLGGKIDKIYWVLLAMVGTIALQYSSISSHNICNYLKILT